MFVDLMDAYDTELKHCLLFKLMHVIPCSKIVNLLNNMLSNLNGSKSSWRRLNNNLPQDSVLAPCLFNLYTSDLPNTVSKKFIYADDLALVYQCETLKKQKKYKKKIFVP